MRAAIFLRSSLLAKGIADKSHRYCDQWTKRQAETVSLAVDPTEPDYQAVAQFLKPAVSRQAVAKVLRGANWHVIREVVHCYEDTPRHILLDATQRRENDPALRQP